MNENYENEIKKIKEYLEEDIENENKNNPIANMTDDELDVDSFDESEKFSENFDEDIRKIEEVKKEKRYKGKKYNPHKKYNIILSFGIILFCFCSTLFHISLHSKVLVKVPFNYISIIISGLSFIAIIVSIILKITHRDLTKSNKKFNIFLTIMSIIIIIIASITIVLFNKFKFWRYLDVIYENKKKCVVLAIIVVLLIVLIHLINKLRKRKLKANLARFILTVFLICVAEVFIAFNFTLYGPMKGFREWLIPTAMATMEHQKYCKWFYSQKEIDDVMSKNYVVESGESTDEDLINRKKTTKYKDEYERQILEHEEGEKYKIVELEVDGQKAFIVAIYDSSKIKVEVTRELGSRGEYVTRMLERNQGILAINGGGFLDPGGSSWAGTPTGITISDGNIITNNEYGKATTTGGVIGFNKKGTLLLLKVNSAEKALAKGVINGVSWGPFLIVNGISSKVGGDGGWGYGARTAIGQRKDGVVLMLVVDSNASRTRGATMSDLTEIMERYGAFNAANLDGGTSSVLALPKQVAREKWNATCHDYFTQYACAINDPIDSTGTHQTRYVATSFVLLDE